MSSLLITIYIITGIISVFVAVLLVHLAKLSSQTKLKEDEKIRKGLGLGKLTDENLSRTILEQINAVENSEKRSKEIAERISDVFNEALEKKMTLNAQELSKKYESIINDKSNNEEVAWKKYNKVLNGKKETEAVIRSIAEGLLVVDAKGKVVMMNPAAEKLLDVEKKDKIGRPVLEDIKKEQLVSLAKGSPDKEGAEIEIVSKEDETKKILRSSTAVIEDENGQTVGMVSVLSDVTKQKELDQMKSDFVSKVSHELRTPIVTVQNSLALLLSKTTGPVTNEQEKFLSIAQRNLKRLGHLIDDLLDLSKLEASKMEMKFESHSIEKLVEEVCETIATWAQSKAIKIEHKVGNDIPNINLDYNKIIQVLTNIIGNAVKFTPREGMINVEAGIDGSKENVLVSVTDTGPGIAKEGVDKVFDKFQQVGERVSTDISGTGLGLSIAKEIVELHGGKIWVESDKGQGAKFTFILPMHRTS
jgi:NtrC-family two-component system sensor histidine kinase KinB